MKRLGIKFSPTYTVARRTQSGAGRVLSERAYGNPGKLECVPMAVRQGTGLGAGIVRVSVDAYGLRVYGDILRSDKDDRAYSVSVWRSANGTDWTFMGKGDHDTLAPHQGGKKAGRDRSVCLRFEWDRAGPGLPVGTYIKVEYDTPTATRVGILVEATS